MADFICSNEDKIAQNLKSGDRDAAVNSLNLCTLEMLGQNSDYKAEMSYVRDARNAQDSNPDQADAMWKNAVDSFSKVAEEERKLWTRIANNQDKTGLCEMKIHMQDYGPVIHVEGDQCK